MILLHLPFPPSVNSANNFGSKGYYPSEEKKRFFKEADALFLTQKRALKGLRIEGPFTYHIIVNSHRRTRLMDGDNFIKYPLDFAQRAGLIKNDKLAEGGSWSWGHCEYGAMLTIWPYQSVPVASKSVEASHDAAGQEIEQSMDAALCRRLHR